MKRITALLITCLFSVNIWADTLVVYSGRGEALVGPLLEQFEKDTGIKLDVRYNSTSALATQVLHEKEKTPADIVFFQESGYLGLLGEAGQLQPISEKLLTQVQPHFTDPKQHWIGTSGRMRVLAYNTDKIKPEELPTSLMQLTDKKWQGRIGWAPSNASFQAHVTALTAAWGEEKTKQWLADMKKNRPVNYPRNAQTVMAIDNGEVDLGWVNHYYLHRLKTQNPNMKVANYYFPEQGKEGNLFIISGVGISKHSNKKDLAEKFIAYLISENGQDYFTEQGFEYPTRKDFTASQALPDIRSLPLLAIEQTQLANVSPTVQMLQSLALL